MDLVIPLLMGSGNNHSELRYALRSFEKFLPHDNLVLIGGYPEWLNKELLKNGVTVIPYRDSPDPKYRESNIYLKVRYYIDKYNNDREFILANDDYFLLQNWNPYPPYPYKSTLYESFKDRHQFDPYKSTIGNTLRITHSDAKNFDIHAPMCIDPVLFLRIFGDSADRKNVIDWKTPYGYLLKSLYAQHHSGYKCDDIKFNKEQELIDGLRDEVRYSDGAISFPYFSTNDPAFTIFTEEIFITLYPQKSRYES